MAKADKQSGQARKLSGIELLAQHTELGYDVPEGESVGLAHYEHIQKQKLVVRMCEVLSGQPHLPSRLPSEIENRVAEIGKTFLRRDVIARSIALAEGGKYSFSGRYESVVTKKSTKRKLLAAVKQVYDSADSEKAIAYREEKEIPEDIVDVRIERFIDADWSGVMFTSNPSYPEDLTIEFCAGRTGVQDASGQPYIIDFCKATKVRAYSSKLFDDQFFRAEPFDLEKLMGIGIKLEKRIGSSAIEFLVKKGKFSFVQHDTIDDLAKPIAVEVPDYKPEQFIAATNVKRGSGKITLPAVVVSDFFEFCQNLHVLVSWDKEGLQMRKDGASCYIEILREGDQQYSEGYALILPHFHDLIFKVEGRLRNDPNLTLDGLTPHKKAVITTNCASIASHVMTIARERGILYAGFEHSEELFKGVSTGDIVSLYFIGREARIYEEKTLPRSIKETHPEIKFSADFPEHSHLSVESSQDLRNSRPYFDDFVFFLNKHFGAKWSYITGHNTWEGTFSDERGRCICIDMGAVYGRSNMLWIYKAYSVRLRGHKPVPDKEVAEIAKAYAKYLTE